MGSRLIPEARSIGEDTGCLRGGRPDLISPTMNLAKSSADPTFGSKSSFFIAARISGVATLALISLLSLVTMFAGVPGGAQNPVQSPRVNRGNPNSLIVGT